MSNSTKEEPPEFASPDVEVGLDWRIRSTPHPGPSASACLGDIFMPDDAVLVSTARENLQ